MNGIRIEKGPKTTPSTPPKNKPPPSKPATVAGKQLPRRVQTRSSITQSVQPTGEAKPPEVTTVAQPVLAPGIQSDRASILLQTLSQAKKPKKGRLKKFGLGLLHLISLQGSIRKIQKARSESTAEIAKIHKEKGRVTFSDAKGILKPYAQLLSPEKPIPSDVTSYFLSAPLSLAQYFMKHAPDIAPSALTALNTATTFFGSLAGGLAVLFGITQTISSSRKAYKQASTVRDAQIKLNDFTKKHSLSSVITKADILKSEKADLGKHIEYLHLNAVLKQEQRKRAGYILRACLGAFAVVGGVLAVASFFTPASVAGAATALAITSVVISIISGAASITMGIVGYCSNKNMKESGEAILFKMSRMTLEDTWEIWNALPLEAKKELPPATLDELKEASSQDQKEKCIALMKKDIKNYCLPPPAVKS